MATPEWIRKSTVLNWLVGRKDLFDRCAERAQTASVNALMLHEEDAAITQQTIEYIESMPSMQINGDTSDGYHTFNELYHHRAVLFSVIVSMFPDLSWKSKQHHDPENNPMYEGMFIVGINTPKGQATYHYDIDQYWNMFKCKELEQAPEYDGHTPDEAIKRIALLKGYNNLKKGASK